MDPILGIGEAMPIVFQGHPMIPASLAPAGLVLAISRRVWLYSQSLCQHGPLILFLPCDLALAWKPYLKISRGTYGSRGTCCSLLV